MGQAKDESIEGLTAGSRVVVHYRSDKTLATIDRETKTQFIVANAKFRKVDGERIGGGSTFFNPYITRATAADMDWFIRRRLIALLNHVNAEEVTHIETHVIEEACQLLGLVP